MRNLSLKLIPVVVFLSTAVFGQPKPASDTTKARKNEVAKISLDAAKRYFKAGKASNAFVELLKAQVLYDKAGNKKAEMTVLKTFAEYYQRNELWPQAYAYYQQALPLIQLPDTTLISAQIQLGLATVSMKMDKDDDAIENSANALRQFTYKGLKGPMSQCYVALAAIKRKQKEYKQAEIIVLDTALPLLMSLPDKSYRIGCYDELGHIYDEQKDYTQAKWFFIQANTQSRESKDTSGIVLSLINLGKVKTEIKDYDLAIKDFKEAEDLAKKDFLLHEQAELNKAFIAVYQKTGNKAETARYTGAYNKVQDSLANMKKKRELAAAKAKEAADSIVFHKTEKKPSEVLSNSLGIYFLYAILVILVIGGLLVYFRRRK